MPRVLIVGGAGYIGGASTGQLIAQDYAIRIYDFLLYENEFLKRVDFVRGDVRDAARLKPHLE